MITKDIVAFLICSLGAILGAYTIALFGKRLSLLKMFTAAFFSGGSLVFFYYYFEGFDSSFIPFMYYAVVVTSAVLFSKFRDELHS